MDNMFTPGYADRELTAALAALEEERKKLAERQKSVDEANTVVTSKDRMLTMTFNGRGELSKLTINNTKYRSMAPNELATVITETLTAGRTDAMRKLGGLMGEDVLPGIDFGELASGKADLNEVISAFIGSALGSLPEGTMSPAERSALRGDR